MKKFSLIGLLASIVLIASCGGGSSTTGFTQKFTSSAAVGEVIDYTFDNTRNTYSYTVRISEYGCDSPASPCHTGTGTLTRNSDGSYTPSGAPNTKVFAVQNGLLVGTIQVAPSLPVVPLVGVANPATNGADMAGTFNFVSFQCPTKASVQFAGCQSYIGTVKVTTTGTTTASYSICVNDDIDKASPTCTSTSTGTMTYVGASGVWEMVRTGATTKSYMVALKAPNGQKAGFIDFNDPGGYGYGQASVSSKVAFVPADLQVNAGRWFMSNISTGLSEILTFSADGSSSAGPMGTPNQPWDGFVSFPDGGRSILAGTGLFIYTQPGQAKYIVGVKM
jgi:hypothetical protein